MYQKNLKCYKLIQLEREPVICRAVVRSPAVAIARHARACPPPLGSRTGPGHQRCRPPIPPARAGPHPPCLVPPGLDLCPPHSHQESCKPSRRPPLPLPPTRQQCCRPAQRQSHEGPIARGRQAAGHPVGIVTIPVVQGGGGEGCRTQYPVTPGIVQPLDRVPPHGHPSSSSSVAGHGGSDGRDSGGSDNDMFCCGMWSYVLCFWYGGGAVCVLVNKPGAPAEIN
jgi:hypothetical protein